MLTSEITGPTEEIGLYCWEKVQGMPGRGTEAEPKVENRWDIQGNVTVSEARKTRQLHLPSVLCRKDPLAKPRGPLIPGRTGAHGGN